MGFFDRLTSGVSLGGSSLVGLSIGASSVKIIELKRRKNTYEVIRYGAIPLPEATVVNRDLVNPMQISESIQMLWNQVKPGSKDVCIGLCGNSLIVKPITLAVANPKELQDQVFWEAEQHIPFDVSEVTVDYQVIGKDRGDNVTVLLVAAKRALVEQYMETTRSSKLRPRIVDAEVFAIQNVYEANYGVRPEATVLVDVGAHSTKIVIVANGLPLFTKDAPFGGASVTQEIQRTLNLTYNDAEALKVADARPQEVVEIIQRSLQNLGSDVRKAIDYYSASSIGPPIGSVLLSGGAIKGLGTSGIVEEICAVPTQILNPFQNVIAGPDLQPDFLQMNASFMVVPMGLAIRAGESA